ncbi:MAG: EamA family transporter [Coriobacteriales bacterium]|nr:EamA family transporter [Coriobacteriales bacterium]
MRASIDKGALLRFATAMVLWGIIGLLVRNIDLPSNVIALSRAVIGVVFLALLMLLLRKRLDRCYIKRNWKFLLLAGVCIGCNWVVLFEAYRFTTVAIATLCYYTMPLFVVAASPFVLHERVGKWQIVCVLVALLGMFFISGIIEGELPQGDHAKGIALGLLAAIIYSCGLLSLRKLDSTQSYDMTVTELVIAILVLLPYVLISGDLPTLFSIDGHSLVFLLIIGIMSTGVAYALYFSSMKILPVQTVVIWGYLDPIVAIFCSAFLLHEGMSLMTAFGAVLILGATLASQLEPAKRA